MLKKSLVVHLLKAEKKESGPRLLNPFRVTFIRGAQDRSPWRQESRRQTIERNSEKIMNRSWSGKSASIYTNFSRRSLW